MTTNPHPAPLRVLVAGGGVAGMEAVLALRDLAGERVEITLLAPERTFAYRPMAVAVPFARGHVQRLPLAEFARETSARLVRGELAAVEPGLARTAEGGAIAFDALLVAVGAWSEPAVPGATTWTPELDQEVMGGLLADVEEGYTKRVAFVVPEGAGWPLPAYELALMTAWDARDMGQDDVEVAVCTPEAAPLEMFGAQASASLHEDLDEAGVTPPRRRAPTAAAGARSPSRAPPRAGSPACRATSAGSSRSTRTAASRGSRTSGPPATAPPSRSSRAGSPPSRPTPPRPRSPPMRAPTSWRSPFSPVLRGVLLTGRGRRWIRRSLETAGDHGEAQRRALWWPPTKVAGAYLAPYLAMHAHGRLPDDERPAGRLVEFPVPVGDPS